MTVVFGIVWIQLRTDRAKQLVLIGAFGVATHILGDGLRALVEGEWAELRWTLWPVLPPTEPEIGKSFAAHFLAIELSPWFVFQTALTAVALVVWYRDGLPGLAILRTAIRP